MVMTKTYIRYLKNNINLSIRIYKKGSANICTALINYKPILVLYLLIIGTITAEATTLINH